ncbi:DUF2911 domain-containing protein [Pedobacter hiemivivus]|uniref:DUF2911 domain-containing protein n=1 Tax=Pedobacter hiemivivus TaxID=2530454 RepID=A0A4U1G6N5_9SPHI|nr:DUF2911 domain-containing protein [Pedobacter hiemivivus]TKC56492.1 DUF2911 domain-containing protein [Pedobacter hiemivivus]
MKKIIVLAMVAGMFATSTVFAQQDKSKRPSPPAVVRETLNSGATVVIDYSQPSVKGRTIGKEIAPFGKVWRTGANEPTTFEVSKAVKVDGKALAAGKYGMYSIPGENEWVIIFGKKSDVSADKHVEADDALRIKVKPAKAAAFTEKMTFTVDKGGKVALVWGDISVPFMVK